MSMLRRVLGQVANVGLQVAGGAVGGAAGAKAGQIAGSLANKGIGGRDAAKPSSAGSLAIARGQDKARMKSQYGLPSGTGGTQLE